MVPSEGTECSDEGKVWSEACWSLGYFFHRSFRGEFIGCCLCMELAGCHMHFIDLWVYWTVGKCTEHTLKMNLGMFPAKKSHAPGLHICSLTTCPSLIITSSDRASWDLSISSQQESAGLVCLQLLIGCACRYAPSLLQLTLLRLLENGSFTVLTALCARSIWKEMVTHCTTRHPLGAASAKCHYARKTGQIYVLCISLPVLRSTKRVSVR